MCELTRMCQNRTAYGAQISKKKICVNSESSSEKLFTCLMQAIFIVDNKETMLHCDNDKAYQVHI